jgi:pyruvate kinase
MRKTKIVCTVGPATNSPQMIRKLISLGVDVFRINFSHGDRNSQREEITTVRREAARAGQTIAILQDLPGPKIRIGKVKNGAVNLVKGAAFSLVSHDGTGDESHARVNYPQLIDSVEVGDLLHLADGIIRLRVESKSRDEAKCTVLDGGVLSSGKGVNAPGVNFALDFPTAEDVADLKFGVKHHVDFVALSFVRTPSDVKAVRRLLDPEDAPSLVAKIEKREAVANFDSILREADGVMVARGDLGIEVPIERVPVIQKEIIHKCNAASKQVIVATQMLLSMVNFPVPSRAEVSDVSTAILDGTDAVMLSEETAVGKYPLRAVSMLDRIARSTEKVLRRYGPPPLREDDGTRSTEEAIGRAACRLADNVGAKAIVAPTQTGSTAKRVSMYRPVQPILALCTEASVARKLKLSWGVLPAVVKQEHMMDPLFTRAESTARTLRLAKRGDRIVVTSGTPGLKGSTNIVKVMTVGRG